MAAPHRTSVSLYDDEDEEDVLPTTNSEKKDASADNGSSESIEIAPMQPTPVSLYDDLDADAPLPKKSRTDSPPTTATEKSEDSSGDAKQKSSTSTIPEGAVSHDVRRVLFSVTGARKGERPEMEDAHVSIAAVLAHDPPIATRHSLYAIFDGHAGARASSYAEAHFARKLAANALQYKSLDAMEKSMKKIMVETYRAIDEAFLKDARVNKPAWKDGTTASTLLVLNDTVYAANIGDSRAIVCRRKPNEEKFVIIELTVDHNPQKFEERQRIEKAGGVVKNGRVDGIIEVSRSIGDGQFKTRGVTCVPDLKKFSLTENDKFILVACDGLWKAFTNESAVDFAWKKFNESAMDEDLMVGGAKARWEWVAGEMAAEAVRRRCGDNVSLLIIVIS